MFVHHLHDEESLKTIRAHRVTEHARPIGVVVVEVQLLGPSGFGIVFPSLLDLVAGMGDVVAVFVDLTDEIELPLTVFVYNLYIL